MKESVENRLKKYVEDTLPGLSVDCVIITFHDQKVKILLNKYELSERWILPGGLIHKDEDIDEAVKRVLYIRTGQTELKLRQFYLFGKKNRRDIEGNKELLENYGINPDSIPHFIQRFVSLGYFTLVRYDKVLLNKYTLNRNEVNQWFDLDDIPELYFDHNEIINKAIKNLRLLINIIPFGHELLPEEFTIVELRKIYEGILGEELDKRNFRKRMLNSGLIKCLDKKRDTDPYPQPILYSYNMEKVQELLDMYD